MLSCVETGAFLFLPEQLWTIADNHTRLLFQNTFCGAVTSVPSIIIDHFRKISYLRTGLKPNKRISVTLSAEDTLKNKFQVTDDFQTDASGKLSLDATQFNSFFARAKNNSNNAFLLPEFDKYFINLESTGETLMAKV